MTGQRDEFRALHPSGPGGPNDIGSRSTGKRLRGASRSSSRQSAVKHAGLGHPDREHPNREHPNREHPNREHEGYLIKELQHLLRARIEARIRAKGLWLSFPHSAVLMTLNAEPGLSGAQLARRNSVTAQTMNGLLLPLESKGLIERRSDPENARVLKCFLKPKGVQILQQGMHEAATVFDQMLGKLSTRERDQFRKILQRCIVALQVVDGQQAKRDERRGFAKRKKD